MPERDVAGLMKHRLVAVDGERVDVELQPL
jgi:hypothetical protein